MEHFILGATVSAVISVVTKELIVACQSKAAQARKVDDSLMELYTSYKEIEKTMAGRSDCWINPAMSPESQCWHDLFMCWYETEDLLDLESWPERMSTAETSKHGSKISGLRKRLSSLGKQFETLMQPRNLVAHPGCSQGSLHDRTPFVCGTARDNDKETIIRKLTSHDVGVSIVGMDGLGKTTLARTIATDGAITGHFSLIMYASVSSEFLTDGIVDKLVPAPDGIVTGWDRNAVNLQKLVQGAERALIVLDDVWDVTDEEWEKFRCKYLGSGAKVLTTNRNPKVAEVTHSFAHYLDKLHDEDCIKIIKEKGGQSPIINDRVWNDDIMGIAKKCMGMPLIASKFGLTLGRKTNHNAFQSTIERLTSNDIWDLVEFREILPSFKLYEPELPPHLKRCFAYCSLFSPKHTFNRDELVRLWKIEGFHQNGSQCFDDLLQRSVFHPSDSCTEKDMLYKMHGLNYRFAQLLAAKVFLRIDEGTANFSPSIYTRHMSVARRKVDNQLMKQLEGCEGLRTFLLTHQGKPIQRDIDPTVFHKLQRLRLLDLSHTVLIKPQYTHGSLRHTIQRYISFKLPSESKNIFPFRQLRYLDVSGNQKLETLPKSINRLRALQVLKLEHCSNLKELPANLCELIRLTHLYVNMKKLLCVPSSLGKLTKLEVLSSYKVDKEQGKVSELGHMDHLREICIYGLNTISNQEEARKSKLTDKKKLKKLALEWDDDTSNQKAVAAVAREVLEGFQPHDDLKDLTVRNYSGKMFPAWFSRDANKLVSLRLQNCKYCEVLPPLGKLPLLKSLALQSFERLKTVNAHFSGRGGFPSLQSLEFSDMNSLVTWVELEKGNMPELQSLIISSCQNLLELPSLKHLGSLVNLVIESAPKLQSLPELPLSLNGENVKFTVVNCPLVKKRCQMGGADWEKIKDIRVKKYIL